MLAFDTHQYVKRLIAVGVPAEQAEAHAEELQTIIEQDLATKQDIRELEAKLEAKIETTKRELEFKMESMKTDLLKWIVGLFLAQTGLLLAQTGVIAALVKLL